jgi:demethylmenaquinone methyltransferase/2-methoxy-6-polyprenyl-1,4-benzoquinol methylase
VFTGHFYGHLGDAERTQFIAQARRLGGELVVVDSALHDGVEPQMWQERVLNDGSTHVVYKRYLTGPQLADELASDGARAEVLLTGTWFVAARVTWP